MVLEIRGKIEGIKYTPCLCRTLKKYPFTDLKKAIDTDATFILDFGNNKEIAVSWWVSAKRTRSYPYPRVYDSLAFAGKKATIIPIFKDEGKDGDRDFLQWDTISLMSLLGVYIILSYYKSAEKSTKPGNKDGNKITNQRFDLDQVKAELVELLSYQSDALHWNMEQVKKVMTLGKKAIESYDHISKETGVIMSSKKSAERKILELMKDKETFMKTSRFLSEKAQRRESITHQPKERVDGTKAMITITNWLKGNYFFTCDEIMIKKGELYLVEAKHSEGGGLPSLGDIKDGLIKMDLFSNLGKVTLNHKQYKAIPVLKLTTSHGFDESNLNENEKTMLKNLKQEAKLNNFIVKIS